VVKSAPAGAVTFVAYEYISDWLESVLMWKIFMKHFFISACYILSIVLLYICTSIWMLCLEEAAVPLDLAANSRFWKPTMPAGWVNACKLLSWNLEDHLSRPN
jgi:hypothetical protein